MSSAYELRGTVILMVSTCLQLIGFVSEESSGKYLYDGDFSVDSLRVS